MSKPNPLEIETLPVFAPLLPDSQYKGAFGGRGSGKSHFFAELLIERCLLRPGTRFACIREVQRDLKESAKLLLQDKIARFGVGRYFEILDREIRTPGGGLIIFRGMNDYTADSIKSIESFSAWVEEAHTLTKKSLELLLPTIRARGSELWFSWNPRHASDPVDAFLRGPDPPPGAVVVRVDWRDNQWFPEELEHIRIYHQKTDPVRYGHVWEGEYEPQAAGALWNRLTIHGCRREEAPVLGRILVGVDPAISAEDGANETGIVVCGLGQDGRGYVLEDASMHGQPEQWAKRVVAAYNAFDCDAVVAEVNQGGEVVRSVLHAVAPHLKVIQVRATRGKHVRAEPISAPYSLGKVSHIGAFPQLESQMCLMTPAGWEGPEAESPDRLDAMVWGFTELFPKLTRRTRDARGYRPQPESRFGFGPFAGR